MKMRAMAMDDNDRAYWNTLEIPLKKTGPKTYSSEKQEAIWWGIATSQPGERGGYYPNEMHLTNRPRIVWVMSGHTEISTQDGDVYRFTAGYGNYVQGRALHHVSHARTRDPIITLNITFPGTEDYEFKK